MNRIAYAVVLALAVFMLLLGGIFIIAGGTDNLVVGAVLIGIAAALFFLAYRIGKMEAAKPKLINQTFNVQMGGSGKLEQKQLRCRSCGAPLEDKDIQVVQGGVIVKCPYCGSIYALEEAPKW